MARRDFIHGAYALAIWGIPLAVIGLTGWFPVGNTIRAVGWTSAFSVMGIACIVNARRCGRVHCWFTGPFFLLLALVSALYGLDRIPLGDDGWSWIGNSLALGGLFLYFVPEWIWGRHLR